MGGLAILAKNSGFKVTGCDQKIYPPMSEQLKQLDIEFVEGFGETQNNLTPDIYIVGNIAKRGMPIIEKILNEKLPFTSGPQWLYENILHKYKVISICGTHGKTTTSSMLAWILYSNKVDCGFLIGGIPNNFNQSAQLPKSNNGFFVIESDEYDTAFFDKRSKFIHYRPEIVIINNLEFDHADIFNNIYDIEKQFNHLIRIVPSKGKIIYNFLQKNIKNVLSIECWSETISFNDKNSFNFKENKNNKNNFDIFFKDNKLGSISWDLFGEHNHLNALASVVASYNIGINIKDACKSLNSFKNVKKRMEIKGVVNGISIYDDFAHHPSEIKTTIDGLKNKEPKKRVFAVLEPRSNTMKTGSIKELLPNALSSADIIFCYNKNINWDIKKTLEPLKDKIIINDNIDKIIDKIISLTKSGDNILIMSNGNFENIHERLLKKLKK